MGRIRREGSIRHLRAGREKAQTRRPLEEQAEKAHPSPGGRQWVRGERSALERLDGKSAGDGARGPEDRLAGRLFPAGLWKPAALLGGAGRAEAAAGPAARFPGATVLGCPPAPLVSVEPNKICRYRAVAAPGPAGISGLCHPACSSRRRHLYLIVLITFLSHSNVKPKEAISEILCLRCF